MSGFPSEWQTIARNIKAGVYEPEEEAEINALIAAGGKTPETLAKINEVQKRFMAKLAKRPIDDYGGRRRRKSRKSRKSRTRGTRRR
jgi:hypothetical protein